jgi:NTE family protein
MLHRDAVRRIVAGCSIAALLPATVVSSAPPAGAACQPSPLGPEAPLAVVLSGGGAKGAYEAGVAATFLRRGLPIRLAAGSSAGALNAAMLVDGRADRLEAHWKSLTREQVYTLRASVAFAGLLPGWLTLWALDAAGSLFDPQPLRELITASLDLERIRASATRLLVVTTDLARRERRIFDNRTVTVDVLMAAAAVPGAFPPVAVDGALLVDGGLIGRAPLLEALESGPAVDRVVVVMSYAPAEQGQAPTTMRRTIEGAFEMSMIHQILRDVELARLKNPAVEVQLLTPSEPLLLRPLDFDPAAMARLLERGKADALDCLDAWERR